MNSLKKGEGVPLLNFEVVPGSWSHFYTMPTFWKELFKTWSMRLGVSLVILVGIKISCSRKKEKQKSR